ncbi:MULTISPECIES: flagellar basal body rod protein FlgB [Methylotenera]|uniref:flagellar basal body rod protein FlgB n=1 Tax=Methylotenera TaxID=359407 RepID=UPI0003706609|nr:MULTISPECIES: flagellar basal body rod protein FlgB [Methylotenera]
MNALDATLNFHQSSLRVRAQRQELLAANIANADTPNYKARDIDFSQAMADALNGNDANSATLTNTATQHLPGNALESSLSHALYRKEVQSSIDGNTVDMDVERNQFTDNALRYEASLTMLNAKIKGLMSAIQG